LPPAEVLSLIRDGKAATISDLFTALGFKVGGPTDPIQWMVYPRIEKIVANLVEAGLVSQAGETFTPTDLIAKVQRALHLSLKDLTKAYQGAGSRNTFVEPSVIEQLRQCETKKHDLAKVIRFCEELNSSYSSGNYLATSLLIRALLNHVPPIFWHSSFQQIVSQSGRSVKELLKPLEEVSRDVSDLHTHSVIRNKECLPTKNQVEPFKANLEVLLHEIIGKVQ
jgi:hypothetical protein